MEHNAPPAPELWYERASALLELIGQTQQHIDALGQQLATTDLSFLRSDDGKHGAVHASRAQVQLGKVSALMTEALVHFQSACSELGHIRPEA